MTNPYETDDSRPDDLPWGITFSDQSTRVVWAATRRDAEEQATADLRAATDPWGPSGWPTGMYGRGRGHH